MLGLHINVVSICALTVAVSSANTGRYCPYLGGGACLQYNPTNPSCRNITFGECTRVQGLEGDWYTIITHDANSNLIAVQRYTDSHCMIKNPKYSNPAPVGYPNTCIGPVDEEYGGFMEEFIVSVDGENPKTTDPFKPITVPSGPNKGHHIMPFNPNSGEGSGTHLGNGETPKKPAPTKKNDYYGIACAHIGEGSCIDKLKVDNSCKYINFGECTSQPTIFFNRNFIVTYDAKTNLLKYRRFMDSKCTVQSPEWILLAPTGRPNTCIGPTDTTHGVDSFIRVEVYFNGTSSSAPVNVMPLDVMPSQRMKIPGLERFLQDM